jgi:hypothetical protein
MRTRRCVRDHRAFVGVIAGAALILSGFGAQAAPPRASARTVSPAPLNAASEPAVFVRPASASSTPHVTRFTATPATVSASGGKVRLLADVVNATLCRFSATPHLPALSSTHDCATGVASVEVKLARNATAVERTYRFKLVISASGESKTTAAVLVHVRADTASNNSKGAAKAPAITTQPLSKTVATGRSASFKAAASGNPAPSVKWQLSTNVGGSWTNIAGAHSATYSFVASASENANEYRAVFTNAAGSAKTHAAKLTVSPDSSAPSITSEPASETVAAGASAAFTAAASGTPPPAVQWQQSTNGGTTWSSITGATATSYSFTAASAENGYEYRAVFSNGVGSPASTNAATLGVTAPQPSGAAPSITTQPANQVVLTGNLGTFTAAASGDPTPSVQWQLSANGGTTWSSIAGATSTTYSFATSTTESGYEYRAVFSNGVGSPASTNAATLAVEAQESVNWSGYFAAGSDGTFTSVSASWTVPSVNCGGDATADSSQWVGIDGGLSTSTTVEQDGTEADCHSGAAVYDAWYEMLGDNSVNDGAEVEIPPSSNPVAPGDVMGASVSVSGTTWTLTIADTTHPWSGGAFSININFSGGEQSSAEWIVERPESCSPCAFTDLSNFGTASFTAATATTSGDGTPQSIAALGGSSIEMVSENGDNPLLAAPSALDPTGEQFTDTWYGSD